MNLDIQEGQKSVNIEILYVRNCPNYTKACSIICDIIAEQDLDASISIRKIIDGDEEEQFRGSPTVLINDRDVEFCFNEEHEIKNPDIVIDELSCRLYNCEIGGGCPSHEMVRCTVENVLTSY